MSNTQMSTIDVGQTVEIAELGSGICWFGEVIAANPIIVTVQPEGPSRWPMLDFSRSDYLSLGRAYKITRVLP